MGKPAIFDDHNVETILVERYRRRLWKARQKGLWLPWLWYVASIERIACGLADTVLVTSETDRILLHKTIGVPTEKIEVVPNGVNIEEFIKIDETTKLLMRKLGLSFENYIIVTPVRVTPRKNIELALFIVDELQHLIGKSRQIKFLITGPPDHQASKLGMAYLEYLRELIVRRGLTENIILCHELIDQKREYRNGNIQKWSVADVYNIADLILIPSREEGFGLPVIEAGAARKPIFCSRIPPFQELIRDDIEGFMFDLAEDPKSIAFRIYRRYLEDRVDNNFDNVIKRFTWESIIRKKLIPLL